jgi:4-amino-4-deoxy-L-arabinose transferase-like glycosyltransferase
LVLQLILRIPFLNEPLEGDEGVYAYMGQRIMAGEVPYRDYFDHKPPVVYYIYAFILKSFGQTIFSIRFATALLSLLTTIFIFLVGRRMFSEVFGLISAFLYALFSGGPLIEGAGSNTEVFMVLFLMVAFYFFTGKRTARDLFFCGLFSGLAFMTKQVAALNFLVFLIFSMIGIGKLGEGEDAGIDWFPNLHPISGFYLILGFLMFPLGFTLYFWLNRGLAEFIDYAFLFNLGYVQPKLDLFFFYRTFYIALVENSILWLLGVAGLIYIIFQKREGKASLLIIWFLASLLGVYLGGFSFGHYFIQVIPALSMLSAIFIFGWIKIRPAWWISTAGILILLLLLFPIMSQQLPYYLKYSPEEISYQKFRHLNNVLAQQLAIKLKGQEKLEGKYLSVRYFPQIFFYTKTIYPGKYFYGLASEGVRVKLVLFKREIYSKTFKPGIREKYLRAEAVDFHKSLDDRRTKYAIFIVNDSDMSEAVKEMQKIGYTYRPDISEADCRVFKRI